MKNEKKKINLNTISIYYLYMFEKKMKLMQFVLRCIIVIPMWIIT